MRKILLSVLAGFIIAALVATAILKIWKPYYEEGYQAGFMFFADPDGYLPRELTADGVHLNAAGYENWKKLLHNYIN